MRTIGRSVRAAVLGGIVLAASPALAALQVITDFQVGSGGASFTPTYTPSSTDLINGQLPSSSAGDFTFELSGGLPVLTNGTYGTITQPGGAPDRTHGAFAVAGGGSGTGTFVQYNLNTAASPLGYNLTAIDVFGGWNDNGRDQQAYTVQYSTVANPGVFINLQSVSFNPTVGADLQTANRATINDSLGGFIATGVAAIRVNFDPATENGYSGYAEIDVIGAAVPEPATAGIIAVGAAAFLARRRRH
jgi:hypothetical protein